jgi:Retrotransposon gag protein
VVENGTSRRLTTEELNDIFTEARNEKEALVKEKEELEAEMTRKGEQYQQELQEKECTLESLAISNDGRERSSEDRDEDDGIRSPIGNERGREGITNVEEIVTTRLAPMADTLSRLTQQMAALMAGKNGEEMSEAAASGAQKAVEEMRMTADGWGGMRIGEANRLYKDNLTAVTVTKAGDSRFAAAKACWDRLCAQFPVSEAHQAKLLVHAFSGQAAAVFQQVAAANPTATAFELWAAMERRLYNVAQVQKQREKVYEARMKREESVEEFAERLRELAAGLPESIDDYVLQQRLIAGLPEYLKVPAATASTDFDTAVTQLGQVAEAMTTSASRRRYGSGEQVNEVRDGVPAGRRAVGELQDGTVGIRDRSKPRDSGENPVGCDPNKPEEVTPWNWSRRCFRCNQFGHIRVGATQECRWPDAAHATSSGNGRRGARRRRPPRGCTQGSGGEGGGYGGTVERGGRGVAPVDRR